MKSFSKGDFIVEYAGDLVELSEAKSREEIYKKDTSYGCYMYFFNHKGRSYWQVYLCFSQIRAPHKKNQMMHVLVLPKQLSMRQQNLCGLVIFVILFLDGSVSQIHDLLPIAHPFLLSITIQHDLLHIQCHLAWCTALQLHSSLALIKEAYLY